MFKQKQSGFTIVELLIVIVVIGILAALVLTSYSNAQTKARQAKIDTDLEAIEKAVKVARVSQGDVALRSVTGSNATGGACWGKTAGTDLSGLPSTDGCWTNYKAALTAIANASGSNGIKDLVDPWGYPYMIDENEQEGSATNCTPDQIGTYKRPAGGGFGPSRDQYRTITPGSTAC